MTRSHLPRAVSHQTALVLFVFVALAFVLLAFRTELNAKSIRRQIGVTCDQANVNASYHNSLVQALIAALNSGTNLPAAERDTRIARYAGTLVAISKC